MPDELLDLHFFVVYPSSAIPPTSPSLTVTHKLTHIKKNNNGNVHEQKKIDPFDCPEIGSLNTAVLMR